jgi:putative FmdB family regulatory protein
LFLALTPEKRERAPAPQTGAWYTRTFEALSGGRSVPLYEYQCTKCHRRTEKIEKVDGPHLKKCPHCGGKVEALFSAPAIQFKGSGWYVTDYAGKKSGSPESGSSTDKSESKDSKSDGGKDGGSKDSASKDSSAKESSSKESSSKDSASKESKDKKSSKKKD